MAGGVPEFTIFCMAIKPPKVVLVSAQAATWMAAAGAAALAHSASRVVSTSSLVTLGSTQLLAPVEGAGCTVVSDPEV